MSNKQQLLENIEKRNKSLTEKWRPIIDMEGANEVKDHRKRAAIAACLENQAIWNKTKNSNLNSLQEAAPTNSMGSSSSTPSDGHIDIYDPVLISLVRRSTPQLMSFDIAGVQPMAQSTGLVFALRARYSAQDGAEALFNEANTGFSAENSGNTFNFDDQQTGSTPDYNLNSNSDYYTVVTGMTTAEGEALGDGTTNNDFNEMAISIESATVTAKSRKLKSEYSRELQQDLQNTHGLDARQELVNVLATEIAAEQNRELVRLINISATLGAQQNVANTGRYDLDVDSNGRWMVERFKGLLFQIEREANQIYFSTRRGKGNIMICSADLASALSMTGALDYGKSLDQRGLNVEPGQSTFAGVLNGSIRVFIDPYAANTGAYQYFTLGYKGSSPWDAGIFYCPYIPLQMMEAVGEDSFQPKVGFMTRYGLIANPFATTAADGTISYSNKNKYYRRVSVENLM